MTNRFFASGTTDPGVTLINAGQMTQAYDRAANSSVTNTASGTLSGTAIGLSLGTTVGAGTLVNAGLITGTFRGVTDGGATISSSSLTVTNQSGATIGGTGALYGIRIGGSGTIVDAGTIGGSMVGISIAGAGSVTIEAGGTVFGSNYAVLFSNTINASTRLAIDPARSISGKVKGSRLSTLELMSGASAGTLSGLGSQYVNFATDTIDTGASWTIGGTALIANRGQRLVNSGSLAIAGTLNVYGYVTAGSNGIQMIGGSAGRLIAHAGAQFSGTIDGGGGTLELATGYYPARLSALATQQLTNFDSVTIDNGANWQIDGPVPNAAPVTDAGYLRGGVILGNGAQLTIAATGTVTNASGAAISGAGTVVNAGSIVSASYGILFASGSADRLILAPGGVIAGTVNGGNTIGGTATSTLELASGASVGTLSGLGSQYVNFGRLALDAGAQWVFGGTNTIAAGVILTETGATLTAAGTLVNNGGISLDPSTMVVGNLLGSGSVTIQTGSTLEVTGSIASTETIVFAGAHAYLHLDSPSDVAGSVIDFDNTDSIDLKGVDPGSVSYAAGQLNFSGGNAFPLTTPSNNPVQLTASADGAEVTALCFLPDTLIQTPSGQVKVQHLNVGGLVTALNGTPRRISWIGTGSVLATRGKRGLAAPVNIRKGAFGPNVPSEDLRVTKGHSFLFDGVLIPIEFLVNHRSIAWDDRAQEVSLYHVELETHDILLANGAPAESYRDDGNRWLFQNANSGWDQPAKGPCAPVLTGDPIVDAVWRRLLDQAGPRPGMPLTQDPGLCLLVDGKRVDASSRDGAHYTFRLPIQPRRVAIASRSAVPQELGFARDARELGIALSRIIVWQGARVTASHAYQVGAVVCVHARERLGYDGSRSNAPGRFTRSPGLGRRLPFAPAPA